MKSPARQQYLDLKQQHQDAILMYRMGDFYEMFDGDAEVASRLLGIQLTARTYPKGEGRVPMAGVPHHSVQSYIRRLLEAGHRVALCEQMSEAGKGLVDRDVVRVFTAGTVVEEEMLKPGENTFLASVYTTRSATGLAYLDVTTGEFRATEFAGTDRQADVESELLRIAPAECLVPNDGFEIELPAATTRRTCEMTNPRMAADILRRQYKVGALGGFGLDGQPAATAAAADIVEYLKRTHASALESVQPIHTYFSHAFMVLDRYTRSSLEILPLSGDSRRAWTLLRVLDKTKTPMGSRRLKAILGQPLLDEAEISRRLDAVQELVSQPVLLSRLAGALAGIGDLERMTARVAQGRSTASDLWQLKLSLGQVEHVADALKGSASSLLGKDMDSCPEVCALIEDSIDVASENQIKAGFNQELDQLRAMITGARQAIADVEAAEVQATGIKSLRVGYNKVFGYYIEISKSGAQQVPQHYVRQQTLVNAERFITPQLKELEEKILSARGEAEALERRLFTEVLERIGQHSDRLRSTAACIAEVDVFRSLAEVAIANNYVRPHLDKSGNLRVIQGRHPVVEAASGGIDFVPNDCIFDDSQRILVLMGPNMGGKSTMLRMIALIVLMAQVGSFVPADEACIGVVDRIFSRVGAQDDIAAGQSTFMTEMVETANILNHATLRSLVILDEIGRGTSTYDGLAIARAVVEFIDARIRARTLFATHYHELGVLEQELETVRNFHTTVTEHDGRVIFLHKIEPGTADRSYGIHVARLAGLPHSVTVRADRLLRQLEKNAENGRRDRGAQLALFVEPDLAPKSEVEAVAIKVLDMLLALDLTNTTPLEALQQLHRFQEEGRSSR